jgi:hypothetical protein
MDRLLLEYSLSDSGPLSRTLIDDSTSGMIRADAPHWSIEPFVPLRCDTLMEYLIGRGELGDLQLASFRRVCAEVDSILQQRSASYQARFSRLYATLDPDADDRRPSAGRASPALEPGAASGSAATGTEVRDTIPEAIALCEEVLSLAGYRRLSQADLENCAAMPGQWGVPLHVDFGLFKRLEVYARGDIIGTRLRRRLRKLYRRESVAVPIYQRMVVMFQLHHDAPSDENLTAAALHLRIFKHIPKQNIDMMLPCTRVRLSGIDRVKIVLPSLGGFVMSIRRIAQYVLLFAAIALSWTAILLAIVIAYLVKCVLSYYRTKNRYQLNLTRNLYFQKLDANAGVGYRIIQQAHGQSAVETMLAYYAMLTHPEPISTRRLRRRCERMIREAIDVEVDFQLEAALQRLHQLNTIELSEDRWQLRG